MYGYIRNSLGFPYVRLQSYIRNFLGNHPPSAKLWPSIVLGVVPFWFRWGWVGESGLAGDIGRMDRIRSFLTVQ